MNDIFAPLKPLRDKINTIDESLLKLIYQRCELSKQIIQLKIDLHLPIKDPKREEELIQSLVQKGEALDPHFIRSLYRLIIANSVELQENILDHHQK